GGIAFPLAGGFALNALLPLQTILLLVAAPAGVIAFLILLLGATERRQREVTAEPLPAYRAVEAWAPVRPCLHPRDRGGWALAARRWRGRRVEVIGEVIGRVACARRCRIVQHPGIPLLPCGFHRREAFRLAVLQVAAFERVG